MIIAWPTQCGKTCFTKQLLEGDFFEEKFDKYYYCYGQYQKKFESFKRPIQWIEGLPNDVEFDPKYNNVLILDDLMYSIVNNKDMITFFTQKSHHLNITLIFIVQNVFEKSKFLRSISLNAHYLVLFKCPRTVDSVRSLGTQIGNCRFLVEVYKDATSQPFNYLLLDFCPQTPDNYRVRSNIFDRKQVVYVPKCEKR